MRRYRLSAAHWAAFRSLGFAAVASAALIGMIAPTQAGVITFGTGSDQFQMEFVTIGNPGNLPDTTGKPNPVGSVGYDYGIGKFEVSEGMITKYNANFGTANGLAITTDNRGPNKPATNLSWNAAARFVNWLNTSTGGSVAYNFTSGGVNDQITPWTVSDTLDYDASNPFRSKRANYVLPSYNEWYKAAYYNPINSTYYDFANGSDTVPIAVPSGTTAGTAVYNQPFGQGPANVNLAGGLSPYGVMGLEGNAFEWEESTFHVSSGSYNVDATSARGIRGGDWYNGVVNYFSSTSRDASSPNFGSISIGFRVVTLSPSAAAVPEPGTLAIGALIGLGGYIRKTRKKG